jgi:hypothetical protein
MASASCGRSALNSIVKASNRACCWRLFAPAGRAVSANAGSVAAIHPYLATGLPKATRHMQVLANATIDIARGIINPAAHDQEVAC